MRSRQWIVAASGSPTFDPDQCAGGHCRSHTNIGGRSVCSSQIHTDGPRRAAGVTAVLFVAGNRRADTRSANARDRFPHCSGAERFSSIPDYYGVPVAPIGPRARSPVSPPPDIVVGLPIGARSAQGTGCLVAPYSFANIRVNWSA